MKLFGKLGILAVLTMSLGACVGYDYPSSDGMHYGPPIPAYGGGMHYGPPVVPAYNGGMHYGPPVPAYNGGMHYGPPV